MRNVLALIVAGGREDDLSLLTKTRPKAAVPFGGLYRLIDFPLSNLMHSGIERVGLLSHYRAEILANHIRSGKSWDMVGRNRRVQLLPPLHGTKPFDWYNGAADAIYQNLDFIRATNPSTILVLQADDIYKMDYTKLIQFHLDNRADITEVYKCLPPEDLPQHRVAKIEEKHHLGGQVLEFVQEPAANESAWSSIAIYVFRPEVLYDALESIVRSRSLTKLYTQVIPEMLSACRFFGYKFYDHWQRTHNIEEYYMSNMRLLSDAPQVRPAEWQVRTNLQHRRISDRPAALIGRNAVVENSLIYNGCRIAGEVRNSILYPGAIVDEGAVVQDSIIMFNARVLENSVLVKSIVDIDAIIGPASIVGRSQISRIDGAQKPVSAPELVLIGQEAVVPATITLSPGCRVYPYVVETKFGKSHYDPGEVVQ